MDLATHTRIIVTDLDLVEAVFGEFSQDIWDGGACFRRAGNACCRDLTYAEAHVADGFAAEALF